MSDVKSQFAFSFPMSIGLSQRGSTRGKVETTPILRVLGGSTPNKFRLNGKATELLMLRSGDFVCFTDTKDFIMELANAQNPELLAWAEANNCAPTDYPLDYFIAKGFARFDEAGDPILTKDRVSKAIEKKLKAEGQIDPKTGKVIVPETQLMEGAKVAAVGRSTAIGCTLNFSLGTFWGELRKEADDNEHVAYTIDNTPIKIALPNGAVDTEVVCYKLSSYVLEQMSEDEADNADADTEE